MVLGGAAPHESFGTVSGWPTRRMTSGALRLLAFARLAAVTFENVLAMSSSDWPVIVNFVMLGKLITTSGEMKSSGLRLFALARASAVIPWAVATLAIVSPVWIVYSAPAGSLSFSPGLSTDSVVRPLALSIASS